MRRQGLNGSNAFPTVEEQQRCQSWPGRLSLLSLFPSIQRALNCYVWLEEGQQGGCCWEGRRGKHFGTVSGELENGTGERDGAETRFHLLLDKLPYRLFILPYPQLLAERFIPDGTSIWWKVLLFPLSELTVFKELQDTFLVTWKREFEQYIFRDVL